MPSENTSAFNSLGFIERLLDAMPNIQIDEKTLQELGAVFQNFSQSGKTTLKALQPALTEIVESVEGAMWSFMQKLQQDLGTLYVYKWKNNEKRSQMFDRICIVVARGKQNSAMVRFLDNGQEEIISRNALRRLIPKTSKTSRNKENANSTNS
jgi:hypothetical protein